MLTLVVLGARLVYTAWKYSVYIQTQCVYECGCARARVKTVGYLHDVFSKIYILFDCILAEYHYYFAFKDNQHRALFEFIISKNVSSAYTPSRNNSHCALITASVYPNYVRHVIQGNTQVYRVLR